MARVINPLTGTFDEVDLPLKVDTNTPSLSINGDIHIVYVGGQAYLYWESNGHQFSAPGTQG